MENVHLSKKPKNIIILLPHKVISLFTFKNSPLVFIFITIILNAINCLFFADDDDDGVCL